MMESILVARMRCDESPGLRVPANRMVTDTAAETRQSGNGLLAIGWESGDVRILAGLYPTFECNQDE